MDIHIKLDLSIFSKIGEWFSSIDPQIWQMAGCVLVVVFGAYAVMSYDDANLTKLEKERNGTRLDHGGNDQRGADRAPDPIQPRARVP